MPKGNTIDLTDRASMNTVVVSKAQLLETLKENRDKHRGIFLEAMAGYKPRAIQLLNEHIARIEANAIERVYVDLPMPSDHTEDYDRAIASLTWNILEEVELTIQEFDWYVQDQWGWKQQWTTSNSVYAQSLQK